jgi:hypothetical protein
MIGYRFFQKISGTNLRNADQKKKRSRPPLHEFHNHTRLFGNCTRSCWIHTYVCQNHSLRVKITRVCVIIILVRVKLTLILVQITLMCVKITLCETKLHTGSCTESKSVFRFFPARQVPEIILNESS